MRKTEFTARLLTTIITLVLGTSGLSAAIRILPIGQGWAGNSVNTVIFRHNSVASDGKHQYVAYYDADGQVVLARRLLDSDQWTIRRTRYSGNIRDAHNSISLMVDGDGYLHLSWDHHNTPLRYCRSVEPGSLELTGELPMTGEKESRVTYPEFYRMADGNLLFLYRDGESGAGNLMMNLYHTETRQWHRLQDGLIDGEGARNAYWQLCVDPRGTVHLSWVWRENPGVESNHDMGYARSHDGGRTWCKSTGEVYQLPITVDNAEYAARIPQDHELINTTSMCADGDGNPYIATYWRPEGTKVPQYQLIYHDGDRWQVSQVSYRRTPFSLSGGGSKRLPLSRPRIVADSSGPVTKAYLIFRDAERGGRASLASCANLLQPEWQIRDLTDFSVGQWEPSHDTGMWDRNHELHLYIQKVGQGDGEKTEELAPTQVSLLEWKPE